MSAGQSAAFEAARHDEIARQAEEKAIRATGIARDAREVSRRFRAAALSEKRLAITLAALEPRGYRVLTDRRWPESRRAQVDFIVVGPSGVWIVDAKSWRDVRVQRDRVIRGATDVTEDFDRLADLAADAESTLAELGLAPGEVRAIAVFTGTCGIAANVYGVDIMCEPDAITHILRRGSRLSPAQVQTVAEAVEARFPAYELDSLPVELTIGDPVMPALPSEPLVLSEDDIAGALTHGILAQPIEHWMAFLHPEQARLASRSFNGPSRIRGAAGTGKTVLGLHRAAYLARTRPGMVLVTSFVRTLPAVLGSLMQRMAPELAGQVCFSGVHAFAFNILRSRGVPHAVDGRAADFAFAHAWRAVGVGGPLAEIDPQMNYWKDEIAHVIKGRGLTRFDDYADLARVGRRRPLTLDQRREVWALYVSYSELLQQGGIQDYADAILLALESLRSTPLAGYSSIIVDEAQDLSCSMVQMLHAVVGDAADGLTLIGDGQQSIYPGGYTLAEAGVSIAGRGVVLTTNYRNTDEISDFARQLVRGDQVNDIDGGIADRDGGATTGRHGNAPIIVRSTSRAEHDVRLVEHVRRILLETDAGLGDIAVLAQASYAARSAADLLRAAGFPTIDLYDYSGLAVHAIKVGTIKRAKGLEFAHVLVAGASRDLLAAAPGDGDDSERRQLARRELYVAMTRARDGLWVGVA